MRKIAVYAVAIATVLSALLVSSIATGTYPTEVDASSPEPITAGSSAKTVVFEVFTGVWCPPCANADPPVSRVMDEYDPSDLLILMYHLGSDPYTNTASTTRDTFYNINHVPSMIIDGGGAYSDGTLWQIGADSNKANNYNTYRAKIDPRFAGGAPLAITLNADMNSVRVDVEAVITATDPLGVSNLYVRFLLYEDSLYYMGSNGEPYHRAVVRDLSQRAITIGAGQTITETNTFTVAPGWNKNKLGVAVLVQTGNRTPWTYTIGPNTFTVYNAEILQSARVDLVPRGIVVYRDEPITDYTEPFERVLSENGRHFDTYNYLAPAGDTGSSDNRGSPTAAEMADRPMVVWYAGSQATTITSADQAEITSALATSEAHLLVTGESLGTGLGITAFYRDVLKATFIQDNSAVFAVQGIGGDPLSNAWASSSLSITGSSPDVVDPTGNGAHTFRYTPAGTGAAIRSDYDADSRVVYMGYRYFEGTDVNRQGVVADVIRWFDAAASPRVSVGWPNGGEVLTSGNRYTITWSAHDVEIPANGVDVYFTDNSGSPTWTLITSIEPNDGVHWWTVPSGVDSDRCRLRVVVRDGQGGVSEDISDADFTIGAPASDTFVTTLQPGRQLLSFPYDPSDQSVQAVLASIDPSYGWVRTYDPSNPSDPWVTWTRGGAPDELNRLDRTMGFWIEITSATPVTLSVTGLVPTSTTISLVTGWNLVGFPSSRTDITVASVKAATGATAISGFDSGASSYMRPLADTEVLAAGQGYWIYVPADVAWAVPYA